MLHFAHMLVFSGILGIFFGHLFGTRGRRWRLSLISWGVLAGVAFLVSLLMFPFS